MAMSPELQQFRDSEKEKWDKLNAHMTPQFKGVRAHVDHASARARAIFLGDPNCWIIPDPDIPEMAQLLADSGGNKIDMWRENKGGYLKDVDPELFGKLKEESDGLAKAYRDAGVHIIRNNHCEYPQGIINFNEGWKGPQFLSAFLGQAYHVFGDILFYSWETAPCRITEYAFRQGTMELFEASPDLMYYGMPFPEPNIAINGPGTVALCPADIRQMPNKHILFGFGVNDASVIPRTYDHRTADGLCSSGNPVGAEMAMRFFRSQGYTSEIFFYDSRITYHFDCLMMNIKEGMVGLPDVPGYGIWGGKLPKCIEDWEILPIPMEDIHRGAANAAPIGDGRVILNGACTKTIDRMEKMGLEPIPVPYDTHYQLIGSNIDCTDGHLWREDNPPQEALDAIKKAQGITWDD